MDGMPGLLPANLPNIGKARLPIAYEGAKTALAECNRIDECQDWADRAEALASYAKQAQDDELRKMADRIQARAIRRCGELLNQIKASAGGRPQKETGPLNPTSFTRTDAARDAGLTRHQHHQAVRVARVPDPEFEAAVEQDEPPTVTALAERGRTPAPPRTDHLNGRDPGDFKQATALLGLLNHISRMAPTINVIAGVRGLATREVDDALRALAEVEDWIAEVAVELRD